MWCTRLKCVRNNEYGAGVEEKCSGRYYMPACKARGCTTRHFLMYRKSFKGDKFFYRSVLHFKKHLFQKLRVKLLLFTFFTPNLWTRSPWSQALMPVSCMKSYRFVKTVQLHARRQGRGGSYKRKRTAEGAWIRYSAPSTGYKFTNINSRNTIW